MVFMISALVDDDSIKKMAKPLPVIYACVNPIHSINLFGPALQ